MTNITIWHNSRCSKSREALAILNEKNIEPTIIKYLEDDISVDKIKEVLRLLNMTPREMMRTKEDIYKELNLKDETNDDKLIESMVKYPKLIERPIIIKGDKAVIARPMENLKELIES